MKIRGLLRACMYQVRFYRFTEALGLENLFKSDEAIVTTKNICYA